MERKTYRIDSIEGKEPLAKGYKIFNWDWTGRGDYCYADADGKVEGGIHTVDGDISACEWGLHFCKNPLDCMRFYAPVQWMRFAEVTAFDEIHDADDGKTVARTLRIDKVLTWSEYVEACKTVPQKLMQNADGVANSTGVNNARGVNYARGVNNAYYCSEVRGVSRCILCHKLEGAKLHIFNKPVTEDRFNAVAADIDRLANGWYPDFTNAGLLRAKSDGQAWEATPADRITGRTAKEAYADMPDRLRAYIKAMPEYDEAIFEAITEGE